jgi:hypothetical protein
VRLQTVDDIRLARFQPYVNVFLHSSASLRSLVSISGESPLTPVAAPTESFSCDSGILESTSAHRSRLASTGHPVRSRKMTGAEAGLVLGLISSCITLAETSNKLIDAVRDHDGLPEAFRVIRDELPMIALTLQNARVRSQAAEEDDWRAVKPVLESCEQQLGDLKGILENVMTSETDSLLDRYRKNVKTLGKGHRVETLARRIFEQLQKLQNNHVFANVATTCDLQAAVTKLEETATFQQLLDSLLFEKIEMREDQIHDSYSETFHWIFDERVTPLTRWLNCSNESGDVFWVSGKAGSGKSTLMKFLANHAETETILQKRAGPNKLIVAKHFFWNSGTKTQQSLLGLLQSLLYQILRQCPELAPPASPQRWEALSSRTRVNSWTVRELSAAIRNIKTYGPLSAHFCFFIDGLDEYTDQGDDGHYQLVQDLDSLAQSAQIKLCVSSRPWTVFKDQYGKNDELKIVMQDHTREDMEKYVKGMLAEDARFLRLANIEPEAHTVTRELVDRADGVFLWVFLVVKSLLRGLTDHDDTSELQRRLKETPADLDAYFRTTFDSIEPVYRGEAMRALQFLAEEGNMPLIIIYFVSKEVLNSKYGLGANIRPMTEAELDKALAKARSV